MVAVAAYNQMRKPPCSRRPAVVLTIGIARLVEGRTQDVNLAAFSGAILIMVGVEAALVRGLAARFPPRGERTALSALFLASVK
jgi:hypothetical protein